METQVEEEVELLKTKSPLIQATYRIGYLEGQLESARKMLTEGVDAARQRELTLQETLHKEKAKAERLAAETELVRRENEELKARIREIEIPWWKKMFRPRMNTLNL